MIWPHLSSRLSRILVAPERRGEGIGSAMVARAVAVTFETHHVDRIDLGVAADNAPAFACYRKQRRHVAEGYCDRGRLHRCLLDDSPKGCREAIACIARCGAIQRLPTGGERQKSRCQEQMQLFGEPKALISRFIQGPASEIAVPEDVVTANATASGPLSFAIRCICLAVWSSASSQLMRSHPGLGSPFGRVRRKGYSSRSAAWTSSGEARPFAQSAAPVG
jgi:hypothetical protein